MVLAVLPVRKAVSKKAATNRAWAVAQEQAQALKEAKDNHNDDGVKDNENPEEDWGDIGAGMG